MQHTLSLSLSPSLFLSLSLYLSVCLSVSFSLYFTSITQARLASRIINTMIVFLCATYSLPIPPSLSVSLSLSRLLFLSLSLSRYPFLLRLSSFTLNTLFKSFFSVSVSLFCRHFFLLFLVLPFPLFLWPLSITFLYFSLPALPIFFH